MDRGKFKFPLLLGRSFLSDALYNRPRPNHMPWNLTVRERLLNKIHLYILTAVLVAIGLGLFLYKSFWLGFPLKPKTTSQVWNVEAHITFRGREQTAKSLSVHPVQHHAFCNC